MANENELSTLLEKLANLDKDELAKLTKKASAIKRDRKAKKQKEALASMFAPLFDAIDKAIASNPDLAAYLDEQKDTLRTTVKGGKVDRDNYRSYKSRAGDGSTNGGRNGTTVWHRVTKEGEYKGQMVEFPSIRALCDFYDVVDNGASGRVDAKKHEIDFLEVRPEGDVVTFSA